MQRRVPVGALRHAGEAAQTADDLLHLGGAIQRPDGGHRLGNMLFDFRMVPFCFFVVQTVGSFAGDGSFSGFGRLMECAGKRSFVVEILLL